MENKISPIIKIEELRVVGLRKNYIVNFNSGLNIIYGDSDTGKSSILNLINYCLGAKNVSLYSELESSANHCLLQLKLNNITYTIKRDIFDKNKRIEVYKSCISNMDTVFPIECIPRYSNVSQQIEYEFFSDFLLEALNIPNIKIKKAPSKEDSELVRLGFRQIFKYCYLDQDEVGSKKILDLNNGAVYAKNKQTFKFINNILDTQITELEGIISEKINKKNKLSKDYETIASFLRETKISTSDLIENKIKELNANIMYLDEELFNITEDISSDTSYLNELRESIKNLKQELNKIEEEKLNLEVKIEKSIRLRKEYEKDIHKLESARHFNIPDINHKKSKCPICNKDMISDDIIGRFTAENIEVINGERKILERRRRSLSSLIEKYREDLYKIELYKVELVNELNTAERLLDEKSSIYISPYISKRDGIFLERANIIKELEQLKNTLKIRNHLELINTDVKIIESQIDTLRSDLTELREQAPSFDAINITLSDYLYNFLDFIGIKNLNNVSIDYGDLLPVIRCKKYSELTSGGLRTLVSVGYFIAMFLHSINSKTNKPAFLMVDTIGKYLGKVKNIDNNGTDRQEDIKEGLSDPEKYKNVYKYILNICDNSSDSQIIIVDNDIPEDLIKDLNPCIIKKFSSVKKAGYEIGLIDDMRYI